MKSEPVSRAAAEAIRAQLRRLVGSPPFARSRRLAQLLTYLVEETLAGRGGRLSQDSIAGQVYGRGEDFSAASDSLVRVESSRLRKALASYYAGPGIAEAWRIELPLRSYRPQFTPREDEQPETSQEVAGQGSWRLPALAVLPFNQQVLGDGVGRLTFEEILTSDLSQFPTARVLAFSPAAAGSGAMGVGENLELAQARELDFAVVGTVRQSSREVRVEVALLDVDLGDQLWSGRFSAGASEDELFSFPYQVSRQVAARVADAYGAILQRMAVRLRDMAPAEAATYESALRFFDMQLIPGAQRLADCMEALERAQQLSLHSAEYYAILGFCQADELVFSGEPVQPSLAALRVSIRHAVSMDSTSSLGQLARAYLCMLEKDPDGVRDASRKMVAHQPNSSFIAGFAAFYFSVIGDYDEAAVFYQDAVQLNPRYPGWFHLTPCLNYLYRGEYELALREANRFGLNDFYWEHLLKAALCGYLGRSEQAADEAAALLELLPEFRERSEELIGLYILDPALAHKLQRGLELAGVLP